VIELPPNIGQWYGAKVLAAVERLSAGAMWEFPKSLILRLKQRPRNKKINLLS